MYSMALRSFSKDLAILRSTYTGPVYAYYDYEKIIKYDDERKLWIGKYCDEQQKVRGIQKKSQAIVNLMVGRSILLRAVNHLNDYNRVKDLSCTIDDKDAHGLDHIGKWKVAGKEYGYGHCDDEESEMNECPLCSVQYAAYKSKRLLKNRIGRINGILTRMGNKIRERNNSSE